MLAVPHAHLVLAATPRMPAYNGYRGLENAIPTAAGVTLGKTPVRATERLPYTWNLHRSAEAGRPL